MVPNDREFEVIFLENLHPLLQDDSGLSNDISPYTITQWTGHSSLAAMKPYMAIADKEKKNAMKKFDEI